MDTTQFSTDIYGRFISNTWAEEIEGRGDDFDVVIIGSGVYGDYAAFHLYNQSKLLPDSSVLTIPLIILVLEAGPFIFIEYQQNQNMFIENGADFTVHSSDSNILMAEWNITYTIHNKQFI